MASLWWSVRNSKGKSAENLKTYDKEYDAMHRILSEDAPQEAEITRVDYAGKCSCSLRG